MTLGCVPALVMMLSAVMKREKFSFVSPLTRPVMSKPGCVSGVPS